MSFSPTNHCHFQAMHNPTIRNAQIPDVSELAEIIVSSFYNNSGIFSLLNPLLQLTIGEDLRYRLRFSPPLYQCLVATLVQPNCESSIAGTVEIALPKSFWAAHPQYPYISNLAVKNTHRRKGVANKLLNQCEQIALKWGYDAIQLHVLEHNASAKRLYLNKGYQIIKKEVHWDGFLNPNSSRLLLRKKILDV